MEMVELHRLTQWAISSGACKACAHHVAAVLMAKAAREDKPERLLRCLRPDHWAGSTCEDRCRDAYKSGGTGK